MTRLPLVGILLVAASAFAQDFRDDLRFAEALRTRGDVDLALEVLNRLDKVATAEQKKELPLEFAKTRLRLAAEEPDTAKRLVLYREARVNFDQFIAANPGHPRLAEANLEIARVLNAQGKTEIGLALLSDDAKTRSSLASQARTTLTDAYNKLKAAEAALEAAAKGLPDPAGIEEPAKKKAAAQQQARADAEVKQATFERGMSLVDRSEAFLGEEPAAASALLVEAKKVLDPLAAGPPASAVTWKATAWVGRIVAQIETPAEGRKKFTQVLNATNPSAADGIRLARYFRLMVIEKSPDPADVKEKKVVNGVSVPGIPGVILESGERWLSDYPRSRKTAEGYGLKYLVARTYLAEADARKDDDTKVRFRSRARALLRDVESSENEFTDRARQLKIKAIAAQGGFRVPVERLKSFEDFYVRAQYEAYQLTVDHVAELSEQLKKLPEPESFKDVKLKNEAKAARARVEAEIAKAKEPGAWEKQRKGRIDTILKALKAGLALDEVKKMKGSPELDSARTMYAFWTLSTNEPEETLRVGEAFIRDDPRSAQAGMTAVYVLQAYAQILDEKRAKFDEAAVADLRGRLFSLAAYVETRWGGGQAGEKARHTLGLQLLREKNYPEAIRRMSLVTPAYSSYPLVCLQLADACKKAEGEKTDPLPGDRDGKDYLKRAMLALDRIPMSGLGADPFLNQVTVAGKIQLMRDLFAYRRYEQMDGTAAELLPLIGKLRFDDDEKKHATVREQFRFDLTGLALYAKYGLADAAAAAGDHAKAAALLDPLVDTLSKGGDSPEKANLQKNTRLATGVLTVALKANLQLGKIDRTDLVLESLDKVTAEGGGGAANILSVLAFLIRGQVDELKKKGDPEALKKAVEGYTAILAKRTPEKRTPELTRALAGCYSSMGQHDKAAAELEKVERNEADPTWKAVRLTYASELRKSKTPENLKKAREVLTQEMGAPGAKAGWAARDLSAMIENGLLMHEEGRWNDAFTLWNGLLRPLSAKAASGGPTQERFFEVTYYSVLCLVKLGQSLPGKADQDKAVASAAMKVVQFEKSWPGMGGAASLKRFEDLLEAEPALKAKVEELKKPRPKKG